MKPILLPILAVLLLFTTTSHAESDLPEGYTLCEEDAGCASLGEGYKCLPQKYPCGPASTCAARVCVKVEVSAEEKDCEAKGGQWQGTIEGRGRLTGCNMPTTDAGKPCKTGEECESVCLLDGTCFGWQMYKGCAMFKGHDKAMCIE